MITIDLANKRLIKIYVTELTETETKILALLSDNQFHTIHEIEQYIHYVDAHSVVTRLVERYDFLIDFEKQKGKGCRIKNKILIK